MGLVSASDEPFFAGIAVSTYQNSGDPNSQWAAYERKRKWWFWPTIVGNARCGESCGFWQGSYAKDIELARSLGANAFRVSLEWSRLMPHGPGRVDASAVSRFHDILACIKSNGMEPFVTLYHFVHPAWFEEAGGFQRQANVRTFVDYCKWAFEEFGSKARFWATMNEANVQSLCGFVLGLHPPGRVADLRGCGVNLMHLLQGHAAAYRAIKALPGGADARVGIVHNIFWLKPLRDTWAYVHIKALCALGNFLQGTRAVVDFLATGRFEWRLPFGASVEYVDPLGPPGLDYIGVNNYTRGVVNWWVQPTTEGPNEVMADFDWPICPSALYTSLAAVARLRLPIYVTENGIPDALDDDRRPLWINSYMAEVVRALRDGMDVRGYMYWTLMDNFEWNFAFTQKFGLYRWDQSRPKERHLREGSKAITQWYKQLPELAEAARAEAAAAGRAAPHACIGWDGVLRLEDPIEGGGKERSSTATGQGAEEKLRQEALRKGDSAVQEHAGGTKEGATAFPDAQAAAASVS